MAALSNCLSAEARWFALGAWPSAGVSLENSDVKLGIRSVKVACGQRALPHSNRWTRATVDAA